MNLKFDLKNKRNLIIIGVVVLIIAALLSAKFDAPDANAPVNAQAPAAQDKPVGTEMTSTQEVLNEETLMAVLWMQNAAEYRALCYQAYNIALERVKWGLVNNMTAENALPPAIVLDLDETALDNSPFDVSLLADNSDSASKWTAWCNDDKLEAIPGAVKFLQNVDKLGVKIFYVTNRSEAVKEGTIRNMARLGFPQLEDENLIFKTDTSDKTQRFTEIQALYNVLVYLGDNLGDMPLDSYHKDGAARNEIADTNEKNFGVSYIMLPNAMYGDWETALVDGYSAMSPEEKYKVRREFLKGWNPEPASEPTAAN